MPLQDAQLFIGFGIRYRLCGLWSGRRMAVAGVVELGKMPLHQFMRTSRNSSAQTVTVGERVTFLTSASKPCVRVSSHTAPRLLCPCHGYVAFPP